MRKFAFVFFCTILLASNASAQVVQENLFVVLSWSKNPEAQRVDRYRVEWSDGGQEWVNLGDVATPEGDGRVTFSTRVAWMKNTIGVGMTVCFRTIAFRGSEESPPSANACGTIEPAPAAPVAPQEATQLTQPETATVIFEYR